MIFCQKYNYILKLSKMSVVTDLYTDIISVVSKFLSVNDTFDLITTCNELYSDEEELVFRRFADLTRNSLYKPSPVVEIPKTFVEYLTICEKFFGAGYEDFELNISNWRFNERVTSTRSRCLEFYSAEDLVVTGKINVRVPRNQKVYIVARVAFTSRNLLNFTNSIFTDSESITVTQPKPIKIYSLFNSDSQDLWNWMILGTVSSTIDEEIEVNFKIFEPSIDEAYRFGILIDTVTAFTESQMHKICYDDLWKKYGITNENTNFCPRQFYTEGNNSELVLRRIYVEDCVSEKSSPSCIHTIRDDMKILRVVNAAGEEVVNPWVNSKPRIYNPAILPPLSPEQLHPPFALERQDYAGEILRAHRALLLAMPEEEQ